MHPQITQTAQIVMVSREDAKARRAFYIAAIAYVRGGLAVGLRLQMAQDRAGLFPW
ncbi:MAG: hypothetical protein ACYC1M_15545 [Armatimonadota bacterium]